MRKFLFSLALITTFCAHAQSVKTFTTTESSAWKKGKTSLSTKAEGVTRYSLMGEEHGLPFVAWGTCFNELDWDAYNLLDNKQQQEIMKNLFSPEGDLHFSRGRLSMNANDYAREWYSCSEVDGDFELRYFNIEHDKQNIIPLIKAAQVYNNDMEFFMSPWSPPTWMKINHDYCVLSSKYNTQDPKKDYMLFMGKDKLNTEDQKLLGDRHGVYPKHLALQDYFIQDPRYLQCYADMFVKFIDLYQAEGINIRNVCYQNEAYSYTVYPGCAWTAEGTVRFNRDYLAPALRKSHPEVKLWLGTFNTNRQDYIEKILSDKQLQEQIYGMATQWECRERIPTLKARHPGIRHWMCSESECGNGEMDWKAGEHTFFLLSDNLGNGVDEYYIWNFLLKDNGTSSWGWNQNALIQVDSKTRKHRYTAEYYAVKHFSQFIGKGDELVTYSGREFPETPLVIYKKGKGYVIVTGNFTDKERVFNIRVGQKYLNIRAAAHSFSTYVI